MVLTVYSVCELGVGSVLHVVPLVEIINAANQNSALAYEKHIALRKHRNPVVCVVVDYLVLGGIFHVQVEAVASDARDLIGATITPSVRSISAIKNVLTITVQEKVLANSGIAQVGVVVLV